MLYSCCLLISEVAIKFAELGANVNIAGRSEERGNAVIRAMQTKGPGQHKFYSVDLSRPKYVSSFTDQITADTQSRGGLEHLILCAGGPPTGRYLETEDGIDKEFAVQDLSRWYTTYKLMPTLKSSVVVVAAPGGGKLEDVSDPTFKRPENRSKLGIFASMRRDSFFLDASFTEFAERHKSIYFAHIFPGGVKTSTIRNSQHHPFIVAIADWIIMPIFAISPQQYASVPVFEALQKGSASSSSLATKNQYGSSVTIEAGAQDLATRKTLWKWCLEATGEKE